jgi:hypothetical protein
MPKANLNPRPLSQRPEIPVQNDIIQNPVSASRLNFYAKLGIFLALIFWFGFFMAEKVDLSNTDLGRHLKNGEIIWNEGLKMGQASTVLNSNFYSYTNPDFPFVNHHWISGVFFFMVQKAVGFSGLSIFYILLSLLTFIIFFLIAYRESDFTTAAALSFFLIPLMAERREIRPEIFSYFFSAMFFLLLWLWRKDEFSWRWLFLLPVMMVFWVNAHIFFFLGFLLIGAFIFSEFVRKNWRGFKELAIIFFFTAAAALINPFGIKGALHPLNVYKNYGYTVAEEKSVWFVENYGLINSNFLLAKIAAGLIIGTLLIAIIINWRKISLPSALLGIFFVFMGLVQIRNLTLLGFFALPVLASQSTKIFSIKEGKGKGMAKENALTLLYITLVIFAAVNSFQFLSLHWHDKGIGLANGNQKAAEFFRKENIQGPFFNNYDIGGYLIYNFFPGQKVFVDNRPEVYPNSFFSQIYKPMQEDPAIFQKIDQDYNFNAVFFYRRDITPWGINFLKIIKENPAWTKVFEDDYAVIYLKKNEANQSIIEKYQI